MCESTSVFTWPVTWVEQIAAWVGLEGCGAYFHGLPFLVVFAPVVFVLFRFAKGRHAKLTALAWASLSFYAMFDWRFIPLLLASAFLDHAIGKAIPTSSHPKPLVAASVIVNLGVLAVFKYAGFAADNTYAIMEWFGLTASRFEVDILLPVGISFYTFQTMSYTIDVYRGHTQPAKDWLEYVGFVTLFPQLVAGPIVRYREVRDGLHHIGDPVPRSTMQEGMQRFGVGLVKKVLIADTIANGIGRTHGGIDVLWTDPTMLSGIEAWTAVLGYAAQLYFDFSGYSDMAIGLGLMMGLRFPENFDSPYRSRDPSEFWQRWHMTLGRFLRDYLYIPIGGNRHGSFATLRNLAIVMVLGGLWHGAAWTFVIWGAYHGILLIIYHLAKGPWDRLPRPVAQGIMFTLVALGWIPFRAASLSDAGAMIQALFTPPGFVEAGLILLLMVVIGATVLSMTRFSEARHWRHSAWIRAAIGALLALSLTAIIQGSSPFLYYQF